MKYLEIEHLKKTFDNLEVLKDISLSVEAGEVVSIIGPSGSGKSTLLRCATMLERMDGGSLSYLGEKAAWEEAGTCVYAPKAELKRIRKNYGLVFQSFHLFPHYNVLKNIIDAPISVDHVPKAEAVARAEKLLIQLGLEDKKDAYPYQLSGGQQQRVSIARALALLKVIRELAKEHMTMIIVTHEMQFARELSDRIIFMEDGVIRQQGTPEELFGNPDERVKEFIGKFQA